MSQTFLCEARKQGGPLANMGEDQWDVRRDGTRTCSYCGSLHPEDFADILRGYIAGEPGFEFDTTTKGYKAYARRPGVENASQGGIKFYGWHAIPKDDLRRAHHEDLWTKAVAKHHALMRERYG